MTRLEVSPKLLVGSCNAENLEKIRPKILQIPRSILLKMGAILLNFYHATSHRIGGVSQAPAFVAGSWGLIFFINKSLGQCLANDSVIIVRVINSRSTIIEYCMVNRPS